jgi:glycine/D-amino acid oxidase-like deaminating enzyme
MRVLKRSSLKVVVVGAGAFGVWTARHLLRLGADVTLVDARGAGNSRASSGGETRVIRAVYGVDRVYVEMVKRSFELWDALDGEVDDRLYMETGALWMHRGEDGYVRSSAPAMRELGFPLEQIELAEAAKRYPQIRFDGVRSVWLEHRAGALSARRACAVIRGEVEKAGGVYRIENVRPGETTFDADAVVYACGPWLGQLFPDVIGERILPTRQEIYYFRTPRDSDRYQPGKLPIWLDFGERVFYGVPDTHGRGFKVADDTRGDVFDPNTADRRPNREGIANARRFLAERFPELANAPLVHSEVCQYENSPDGHLILDKHPSMQKVWIAGGGSGHGFKLSPAIGEMVAHAIVNGAELPAMFRLDRPAARQTQFERG